MDQMSFSCSPTEITVPNCVVRGVNRYVDREVPFIAQILLFLGINIELPVKVWIDNVGAIFMTENKSSSSRTRHMDNRFWYVHQLQEEDGLIKVNFVRTKENVSDIGTKNVNAETYDTHQQKLIAAKETVEQN